LEYKEAYAGKKCMSSSDLQVCCACVWHCLCDSWRLWADEQVIV